MSRKTTLVSAIVLAGLAAGFTAQHADADLLITEIRTKAASNPEDFFEITNLGVAPVDITDWKFDDESADIADAAPLVGITSIAPGESVVFFQLDESDPLDPAYDPAGELAFFRNLWGGLAGVQVGYHGGPGLGKGDAINIFDAADTIVLSQAYGMTTPEETHAGDWAANNTDGSDTYENESAIWVPGTLPAEFVLAQDGVYGSFANLDGEYGSPGIVPEPASLALLALGVAGLAGRRRA